MHSLSSKLLILMIIMICIYSSSSLDERFKYLRSIYEKSNVHRQHAENACLLKSKVKENCKFFMMHIHKAGGSTLCGIARANNLLVPERNCNLLANDPKLPSNSSCFSNQNHTVATDSALRWNRFDVQIASSCFQEQPYNLIAVESYGGATLPIGINVLHLAVIREPVEMCLSLVKHERRVQNESDWGNLIKMPLPLAIMKANDDKRSPMRFFCSDAMVKAYTGCGSSCRKHHLQQAKRMLNLASAIIIRGNFRRYTEVLALKFGWDKKLDLVLNNSTVTNAHNYFKEDNILTKKYFPKFPGVLQVIKGWNLLDLELYEHAKLLAEDRLREARSLYSHSPNSSTSEIASAILS